MPSQAERADQIGQEVTAAVAAALGGRWTGVALLESVLTLSPWLAAKATAEQVIHALHVLGFVDSECKALVDALTGPVEEAYTAGVEYAADTQGVPQTFDPEYALPLGGLQHALDQLGIELEGAMLAQAQFMGGVDKRWSDAPGACLICRANTAEGSIRLDKPFSGGVQHPLCRCALALVPTPIAAPSS